MGACKRPKTQLDKAADVRIPHGGAAVYAHARDRNARSEADLGRWRFTVGATGDDRVLIRLEIDETTLCVRIACALPFATAVESVKLLLVEVVRQQVARSGQDGRN